MDVLWIAAYRHVFTPTEINRASGRAIGPPLSLKNINWFWFVKRSLWLIDGYNVEEHTQELQEGFYRARVKVHVRIYTRGAVESFFEKVSTGIINLTMKAITVASVLGQLKHADPGSISEKTWRIKCTERQNNYPGTSVLRQIQCS